MIINKNSINSAAHLYLQQSKALETKKKSSETKKKAPESIKAAEVSLSPEAKELAKATQSENKAKLEKLASLKSQIQAGTYKPKAEEIADSILRQFWGVNQED